MLKGIQYDFVCDDFKVEREDIRSNVMIILFEYLKAELLPALLFH